MPFKVPFFEYSDGTTLQGETPIPFRQTGFVGELKYNKSTNKYYLITNTSETINLVVPTNVDFADLLGRRIFATGIFYPDTRNLEVESIEDLEILPINQEVVPTTLPTPTQVPQETAIPETTPTPFQNSD